MHTKGTVINKQKGSFFSMRGKRAEKIIWCHKFHLDLFLPVDFSALKYDLLFMSSSVELQV